MIVAGIFELILALPLSMILVAAIAVTLKPDCPPKKLMDMVTQKREKHGDKKFYFLLEALLIVITLLCFMGSGSTHGSTLVIMPNRVHGVRRTRRRRSYNLHPYEACTREDGFHPGLNFSGMAA